MVNYVSSREAADTKSATTRYYFSRLNIIASYSTDKYEFVLRGIDTFGAIHKRNHTWGFFEVDTVDYAEEKFITGYLVKYDPSGEEEEVVNPDTQQLEETKLPNSVASKSRFFLHVQSGLVAYYLRSGISSKQFKERFKELFERSYDDFFVDVTIQDIEDQYDFFERIDRLQKVLKVEISLHPSNPSNHDRWKSVDERIKGIGADKYKESYEAKEGSGGLNVKKDEDFNGKAHMAQDGYGKTKVVGLVNDDRVTISTGEKPLTAAAPIEGEKKVVLSSLLPTFKNVFNRTPNKNKKSS